MEKNQNELSVDCWTEKKYPLSAIDEQGEIHIEDIVWEDLVTYEINRLKEVELEGFGFTEA